MSKYVIVWNEYGNEGVIFRESKDSRSDALHAAGGQCCNPWSTLADDFRENYGTEGPCKIQEVEIDETQAVSRRAFMGKR